MAKCPKCSERKGKRACPALGTEICAACCAENRLKTIACPQDCRYLQSEIYQHGRRRQRAYSQGRRFVETSERLFTSRDAKDFAFKLQADIYFHARERGPPDDAAVARALDSLINSHAKVYVPETAPEPLAAFLIGRLRDHRRYPESASFSEAERVRTLKTLAAHVRSRGGEGTRNYHAEVSSFFDALDFEADLNYSPHDEAPEAARGPAFVERQSGLILPPGVKG